jgi:Domain of Unknown Function with PDB structure (DUF3857)
MRFYLILCCLSGWQLIYGQSSLPAFGEFTAEEINLKECPFDKNAEAVILFDDAVAEHDDDYRLVTHRRIRIKIFNQREIDRGNIRIPFYSKDKFEFIIKIRGITYTVENGAPVINMLDSKSIFTEKETNLYSTIKFALPNVKPGTIIEYEYTSVMENYGGLSDWEFQNDIPTLKSCFLLTILPGAEFQYLVQKKINYPILLKPIPDEGKIYFEMNNVPGLKFEPYMDAVKDYLQRVEFQLSGFTNRFGDKTKVAQTWEALAYELINDKSFGGAIKKNLSHPDEIKALVSKETSDSGKIAVIYNYVRNNFTLNGYHSKYASDGLKTVWEKRTGNTGELNLLLINLLQTFDIEVYPFLVAERSFGKINVDYPFVDRFNKVVAYAKAGNKIFILDATQKYTPPGLTPFPLLNTIGFLVDKKDHKLLQILSNKNAYDNKITVDAKIDNTGLLKGKAQITSSSYAKQVRTEKIKNDSKKFIKNVLEEPGSEVVVDNCTFENLDDDSNPLVQKLEFHHEQNVTGGFVFVTYNLFTGLVKNPFTADERFTNINFGYPYEIRLQANIQLPDKAQIDKLPPDKTITSADKSITLSRKLKVENNTLTATVEFIQTTTLVSSDQYDNLKSLYKQIVDLLNESVIIKVAN